ncbi:Selenophosphate-dependent tRNA 2-selenouridine synthase [Collimonas arenae]|uniref:Selenophosphate-dependent tRNA 2-selenouridine synthase n=1 Tax=Collimonas arenae TaxID=279058 RepID=A0A0A1FBS4_9BURK|nr:tRNA 2-selenouridine(34) synthase MnmH [Collimonas arenae]AIY42193.1 Selenophosphate-dependent tRNA 2-selenouridine synthase [Collimonas arenae]
MKYPALLSFEEVFQQIRQFDTIIDARTPAEFAEDRIPGAINCPVLDDAQRVQVGTLYKQVSAFEAKKLGAVLVARNVAQHIETLFIGKPREWTPLIYCWRGGNRSGAMAHIMAKIGWPVVQLDGGYKEFRRYVISSLEQLPLQFTYKVICGPTGSGKSRLLQVLEQQGAQVLDLEQIAAHRGSVLGNLPQEAQPSQKAFESRIWDKLQHFDVRYPVFVESESKKIGNLRIPEALMMQIRKSQCIALALPRAERVKLLMEDYAHFVVDPVLLNAQLSCLAYLHGRETVGDWQKMASAGQIEPLVDALLLKHYDPAYAQSIKRNFDQFSTAQIYDLPDISAEAFLQAARQLHQDR